MSYWICITTRENWEIIKKEKIWGVPERHKNTIRKVKPGDKLIFYLRQERVDKEVLPSAIAGIMEASSEVFLDRKRIFKGSPRDSKEIFPYRVKLKEVKIPERPVEFKPLIPKLKFIKNKSKWAGHLMGKAMREIPEEDYKLIEKAL